jgi:hypothetical protein
MLSTINMQFSAAFVIVFIAIVAGLVIVDARPTVAHHGKS